MLRQKNLKNMAILELARQQELLDKIESSLPLFPEGHIETDRRRDKISWHHSWGSGSNRKKEVIDRTNAEDEILYQKLLLKQAYRKNRGKIKANIAILKRMARSYNIIEDPLLTVTDAITDPQEWANEKYRKCDAFPRGLNVRTESGTLVRSKSEASIFDALKRKGIFFRYEAEMLLENIIRYPDFTIVHPRTHQLVIWEHDGRLDNLDHTQKYLNDIMLYGKCGFVPGENFIITSETPDHPFSAIIAEKNINKFLS